MFDGVWEEGEVRGGREPGGDMGEGAGRVREGTALIRMLIHMFDRVESYGTDYEFTGVSVYGVGGVVG